MTLHSISRTFNTWRSPYYPEGTTQLMYAVKTSATYTIQTVGFTNIAYFLTLVTDSVNRPHVFYYNSANQYIHHAYKNAASWDNEIPGIIPTPYFSAVIGSDNIIHLLTYDFNDKAVKYHRKSGSTWSASTVHLQPASMGMDNPGISIAVDSAQNVYACWYSISSALFFGRNTSQTLSGWSVSTIDDYGNSGYKGAQIKVDKEEVVRIAYTRGYNSEIRCGYLVGNIWNIDYIYSGSNLSWPVLLYDLDGNPTIFYNREANHCYYGAKVPHLTHISYYSKNDNALNHTTQHDGIVGFPCTIVENGGPVSALAMNTVGYLYVLYSSSSENKVYLGNRGTNERWFRTSLFSGVTIKGPYGNNASLKFSSDKNRSQVAFIASNNYLLYGKDTDFLDWAFDSVALAQPNLTPSPGHLDVRQPDAPAVGAVFMDMALDTANQPHIVYCNYSSNIYWPIYSFKSSGVWVKENIENPTTDKSSTNGWFPKLQADTLGNIHVIYTNKSRNRVYYAFRKNGTWQTWLVDTQYRATGWWNGIVLDEWMNPHLAYCSISDTTMRYAQLVQKNGMKWITENIQNVGKGGKYTNIALRDNYQPEVTYQFGTTTTLYYVQKQTNFFNLPDIKLLRGGYSKSSVINLEEYRLKPSTGWSELVIQDSGETNVTLNGTQVSYGKISDDSLAVDTVTFSHNIYNGQANYYNSILKYSTFLLDKLPSVYTEGSTIIENSTINLNSYLSKSSTYSGDTYWMTMGVPAKLSETGQLTSNVSSGRLSLSLGTTTLSDRVDLYIQVASSAGGAYWDQEIVRVYPILNSHSGFVSASETTQWAYQLPEGIATKPLIGWDSTSQGTGGTKGSMRVIFKASNLGIKLTPLTNNWVKTEPNTWYTVRVLTRLKSTTVATDTVQFAAWAFNGLPPQPTDLGAYLTLSMSTKWRWYETALYSNGTVMYPQIVIKNGNVSDAEVLINKVEVVKRNPGTELLYGKKYVKGMYSQWDSSTETTCWAAEALGSPSVKPDWYPDKGKLVLNFADTTYRGIKLTSMVTPGTVRTGVVPIKGHWAGGSMKISSDGKLSNPVVIIYIFGAKGPNQIEYNDLAATASLYKISGNETGIMRQAYVPFTGDLYQQIVIKNAGAGKIYLDDFALEAEQDTSNYWDFTLFNRIELL